ncbi:sigma-70 family RNA polymerase sigma factor [Sinomicrobium pectinilyticum]|uniref:Sigma-70 family RNA polymerase sigma factor n=1 Tax=Sinomicrobium pectinilyticum TaxID=1084421 RepID=A0A3N0E3V5_SINP1|nr:sigma-70 family RNA polymerase sigma factor [Sinomicrobium pectinilyticum]RNL82500.1 sigma-70 family RNA polymerase sigma factor [Sinomicrobium pectinilyticum]
MYNPYKDYQEFILQLKKGNENAYAHLVTTYYKKLFIYALSLTHDHGSAEDIVQNVFLKTWESRNRLNPVYSIKNFLYKTTYNEFTNHYHKTKANSQLEHTYVETMNEIIEENEPELLKQKIAIIFDEINLLPNKCKKTLLLRVKEGLTNIEIAEYMNVSVKTVEGHLTKAYNQLRKNLTNRLK